MNEDKLEALLSGYASGTLTAEEQTALFTAALERQDVFDALLREQALRETLDDPQIRSRLLSQLQPQERAGRKWSFAGLRSARKTVAASSAPPKELASFFDAWRRASAPFALWKWAGALAAILLVAGISLKIWRSNERAGIQLPEAKRENPEISETLPPPATTSPAPAVRNFSPPPSARKRAIGRALPPAPAVPQTQPKESIADHLLARDIVAPPAPPQPGRTGFIAGSSRSGQVDAIAPTFAAIPVRPGENPTPRALFQTLRKNSAAPASADMNALLQTPSFETTRRFPAAAAPAKRALQQTSATPAIRVALHLPGQNADIDWRAVSDFGTGDNQRFVVQVNTASAGYVAIVETPSGSEQILAPGNTVTLAGASVRAPLVGIAGTQVIAVIYSPAPLTPDRITHILGTSRSNVEETHNGVEHAMYASPVDEARELAVRLVINLH